MSVEPSPAPSNTDSSRRLGLWGPVLLYCALIFALSSISSVPALPGRMSDKTAHALLYSGLGFLAARALSGGIGRPVTARVLFIVLAFSALYGLSDEIHQLFVPSREFDLKDMAADVAGGGIGAAALWVLSTFRRSSDAV
jgi:VanZ family protein